MRKILKRHQPCPRCGSSDANTLYHDGEWCFSCGTGDKKDLTQIEEKSIIASGFLDDMPSLSQGDLSLGAAKVSKKTIGFCGLEAAELQKYGVYSFVTNEGKVTEHVYPYPNGAEKHRRADKKDFYATGPMSTATLFGMDKFSPGCAQSITLTEGEKDAVSAYKMMGSKYPCVSVRGAQSAKGDCQSEHKYLNSFEKIYICFDNDEPGQKAAKEVASLFDVNKVYFVEMGGGCKDANDYLTQGRAEEFRKLWWNAKRYIPKGILKSNEQIAEVLRSKDSTPIATLPFHTLQDMTYGLFESKVYLFTALEKVGKGLWIGTSIPTPTGWTTIGDLKVGDKIFSQDGSETAVTFITEENVLPSYKVVFSDSTSIMTDNVHRWSVRNLSNNVEIKTTQEMYDEGVIRKGSVAKFRVPSFNGVEGTHKDLLIDPYLLGVWLGDGHAYSANITVSFDMVESMEQEYTVVHKEEESGCYCMRFEELQYKQLTDVGVLKNKHIPMEYLRSSREQREALFKGLTDTDGWGNKEFYSSSPTLFKDVVELARSLGYHVTIRERQGRYRNKEGALIDCKTAYSMRYRKDSWKSIRDIIPIADVTTRCLTVDHPSHLFVAGDGWTITHNTEVIRAIEYHLVKNTEHSIGIIHLEEEEKRSVQGLLSYEFNTPCHLPDCNVSVDEQIEKYAELIRKDGRVNYYTHFGSDDPDTILDIIRYLVTVEGCKVVFLDHITMLVTGFKDDDERKKLDYISTRLAMMTRELKFALVMISHVNDQGQTRGSRNISKVADYIIHMERNTEAESFDERNTTKLTIKGNRFAGRSGPAGYLRFDPSTYTIREPSEDELKAEAQVSTPF